MSRRLGEVLRDYTRIVVWGTGNFYAEYRNLLDERVVYFVDNDAKKWGTLIDQKEVFSPEKLRGEDKDETLVIICNHFFEEISAQIKQYGDLDIIDIVTVGLVRQKERVFSDVKRPEADRAIIVCGGIHALWQINGSRKFIDGQLKLLHQSGYHTIEIVPLLYYRTGKRESSLLAVSADGAYQGLFSPGELAEMYPKVRGMVIHSLYYSQTTMKTLLESVNVKTRVLYYIHDYSCLCSYRFLYKEKKLCIGSDGNMICDVCSEDRERRKLLQFYRFLFKKYKVLMIAPSADTKARVEPFYGDIDMVEMAHLEFEREVFRKQVNNRLRIAYLGAAVWNKGWERFAGLADRFQRDYDFYCLGNCPEHLKIQNVAYVSVGLEGAGGDLTMTEALLQYGIDIAYIGSILPETYGYTYYEAYEAGLFILTDIRSGNVCRQVNENQNGLSFSCDDEMAAWLARGNVKRDVQNVNQRIINVRNNKAFLKYFE
ncbi:MAG: glycosyltransferase family 4 protein [Dorea sp.]|jgi:hypothetical protein|nr:glycosyltransferase family 4 protein [Dorea sp.]